MGHNGYNYMGLDVFSLDDGGIGHNDMNLWVIDAIAMTICVIEMML